MTYVDPHLAAKISAYADILGHPTPNPLPVTGASVAADLRAILDGTYDPERRRPHGLDRCDLAAGTHVDPHRGCPLRAT